MMGIRKKLWWIWSASGHLNNALFWFGMVFSLASVTAVLEVFSEIPLWLSITGGLIAAVTFFLAYAVYVYIIVPKHIPIERSIEKAGSIVDPHWSKIETLELYQAACIWAGVNPPTNEHEALPSRAGPFLQRLKAAIRSQELKVSDNEMQVSLGIQGFEARVSGRPHPISNLTEISQTELRSFIASETAKGKGDDENGFSDEFEYQARKIEGVESKRDKSLDEAITYILVGRWGGNVARASMDGKLEGSSVIQRIRQAAVDGRVRIWGKQNPNSAIHKEIEAVFWETHQPEFLEFLRGRSRTEAAELGASNERYYDLMISRAEIERELPYQDRADG
ncbi:hypothetical protein [Parasphingorhabdus sp.]|uniref:hypothetical protein n=1 Tax=Parasphingorhabdus sp. TaxID=2709688 RepID=UPI0030031EA3